MSHRVNLIIKQALAALGNVGETILEGYVV